MIDYYQRIDANMNQAREAYNMYYHDDNELLESMDNLDCFIEDNNFTDSLEEIEDIGRTIGKPSSPSQDPKGFLIWSNLQEVRTSIYALNNKK